MAASGRGACSSRYSNTSPTISPANAAMTNPTIAARIRKAEELTGTPVRKVVLTSADPSCALGVLLLEDREFEVLCHGEARRAMAENAAGWLAVERGPEPRSVRLFDPNTFRLPDRSLESMERLQLGDHRVRVVHMPDARTA